MSLQENSTSDSHRLHFFQIYPKSFLISELKEMQLS
jgi:hypothetical protein